MRVFLDYQTAVQYKMHKGYEIKNPLHTVLFPTKLQNPEYKIEIFHRKIDIKKAMIIYIVHTYLKIVLSLEFKQH